MKKIFSNYTKISFLYIYGIFLYALLTIWLINFTGGIEQATREGNQFVIDGAVKLYWGILFGSVFFYLVISSLIKNLKNILNLVFLDKCFLLWLSVDMVAFLFGIIFHNSIRYILSDLFLFSLIPLSYFFVKENLIPEKKFESLFYIMLFSQVFIISFPVDWGVPSSVAGFKSIGFSSLFGAEAFVTISLLFLAIISKSRLMFISLLVLAIEVSLIRQRMTYLVQVFAIIPVFILFHLDNKIILKRLLSTVSIVFLIIFALNWQGNSFNSVSYRRTAYFAKVAAQKVTNKFIKVEQYLETKLFHKDIKKYAYSLEDKNKSLEEKSTSQKNFEIKEILKLFKKNPSRILFGFGNGATADFSKSPDATIPQVYGAEVNRVHNIHFLPIAILFRQGLLGLFVFVLLCVAIIQFFLFNRSKFMPLDEKNIIFEILFLNFIAMLIGSIFNSPHLFTSLNVGFGIGIMMTMVVFVKQKKSNNLN